MVSVVGEVASGPVNAQLEVCSGRQTGQRFPINAAGKVLGSSPSADIQLDDARISELHAMVVLRDDAHFVFDLGSETGSYLNQQRIEEAELQSGDLIQLGDTVLRYVAEQPVMRALPPPQAMARYLDTIPPQMRQSMPSSPEVYQGDRMPGQPQYGYAPSPDYYRHPPPLGAHVTTGDDDKEMSLGDLLAKVRAVLEFFLPYWRSVVACMFIGGIFGMLAYFFRPPPRHAQFSLSLVETLAENPVDGMRQHQERPAVEFFRSAELNFKSPALIEKTLAALGESDASPERVAGYQARLEFGMVGFNSSTYMGGFTAGSGDEALRFLNAHVKLYLEEEIEKTLRVIKGQTEFLDKQLADTERDLRRTEWELLEFKKKNLDGLPEQAKQNYELMFELQKTEAANDREIARVSSLRKLDQVRLRTEDLMVPSRVANTRPYQQSIVELNRKIAESRAKGLGVDHPDVIRMRNEVEELTRLAKEAVAKGEETEVEKQINPAYTSIRDNLRQLEASEQAAFSERDRIKKELDRVRGVVDRLPELENTYAELTRSYEARKQIHSRIFNQLETSRLQVELERASAAARYDIIAPPTLELASPLKGIVIRTGGGMVLGFMAGLSFAAYRQLKGRFGRRQPPPPPPRPTDLPRSLAPLPRDNDLMR